MRAVLLNGTTDHCNVWLFRDQFLSPDGQVVPMSAMSWTRIISVLEGEGEKTNVFT